MTLVANTPQTRSVRVVAEYVVLKTGAPVGRITTPLAGNYVTLDTTATTMATLSMACLDPQGILAPTAPGGGELNPDGPEIQVRMGFQVDTTEPSLWTQGVYLVTVVDDSTSAATVNSGGGNFPGPGPNLTITGYDRSKRISLALFDAPFTIAKGTTVGTAIEAILASQASWCKNPNISPSTVTVQQQTFNPGTDPWSAITALAASAGMVAYFDQTGTLVVRPTPSQGGAPTALQVVDGPAQIAMSCTTVTSATPGYNGVIVVGSSAAGTGSYSGVAYTRDPSSPLYATGPYGRRPAPPATISTATSDASCVQAAEVLLSAYLGLSRSVILDILPCPFLWAYDLVFVKNATTKANGIYITQQVTRYLDYSEQESDTLVPLGTPISQLAFLQNLPPDATISNVNQLVAGATTFTTSFTTTFTTGSFGGLSGGTGLGLLGFGGIGGAGLLGFGGGWGTLWGGGFMWRRLFGGWGGSTEQTVVDDGEADVEEVL